MSLCRFLPTPSDRMGILWSLLNVEDAIVLEYGPAGTTHYSMGFFGKLHIEQENRLFTTHMSEDDVVMGDTTRLEDALVEIDETFSPKVIFVVASSVSSVIGTDIAGVCNVVAPNVKAKLIALEEGGFKGDYSTGLKEVYTMLVKRMVEKSDEVVDKTFNIIGASTGEYRASSDIKEIARLMKVAFGFKLNTALCAKTTIEDIKKMSSVKINLVISNEGLTAAKFLQETFGTPYIYACSYGYKGTQKWLSDIADIIEVSVNSSLEAKLKERIAETMQYRMYGRMLRKFKPVAYVYSDYDRAVALAEFLNDLSLATPNVISKHSLKNILEPKENVKHLPTEKDRINVLKGLNKTLIFADDVSNYVAGEDNSKIRFSCPIIKGSQISTHLPFVGIRGADYIRECVDEYISTLL